MIHAVRLLPFGAHASRQSQLDARSRIPVGQRAGCLYKPLNLLILFQVAFWLLLWIYGFTVGAAYGLKMSMPLVPSPAHMVALSALPMLSSTVVIALCVKTRTAYQPDAARA